MVNTCAIRTSPNPSKYFLNSGSVVFQGRPNTIRSEHFERSNLLFLATEFSVARSSSDFRLSALGMTVTYTWVPHAPANSWGQYKRASVSRTPRQASDSGFRYFNPQAPGNCPVRVVSRSVPSSSQGNSMGSSPSSSATLTKLIVLPSMLSLQLSVYLQKLIMYSVLSSQHNSYSIKNADVFSFHSQHKNINLLRTLLAPTHTGHTHTHAPHALTSSQHMMTSLVTSCPG